MMARREKSRRNLLPFIQLNFPTYRDNWHHRLLIEALERVERGELKRLIVLMPPRHGKSEIASIQFPSWFIGRNPEKSIIAASYAGDLALDFGRKTRDLVHSKEYGYIFSGVKLKEDSQAAGRWATNKGGSYIAAGVGGALTGRGADVFLIDDPVKNREEADSEVLREKTWDWYRSTVRTRLSPKGAIVVVQTRWHDDDLVGRLLSSENAKEWEVIEFPAIATQTEEFRKIGDALWEDQYSLEILQDIKRELGSYEWSSLYQQQPVDEEAQEFKKEMFKERRWDEVEKLSTRRFLTIDTAVSQKAAADFTGICDNRVDDQNFWNLRAWRKKLTPMQLIDMLFSLHEVNHYEKIGIEKTIYLQAIKPFLDEEMRKREKFLPVVELDHKQVNKHTRIRGLLARYESGSVFHVKEECRDLEEELLRFPKARNDDVSDATAYQLQLAEKSYGAEDSYIWEDFALYPDVNFD